jgi:hypothetical protein
LAVGSLGKAANEHEGTEATRVTKRVKMIVL